MNKKIIVFDCGGVLGGDMKYDFVKNYIKNTAPEKLDQAIYLLQKQFWARIRIDRTYTDRQYFIDVLNTLELKYDDDLLQQFMTKTKEELFANKPCLQVALNVHKSKGIDMYILSNHAEGWFSYIFNSDPMFREIFPNDNRLVISCDVGYHKPQQEIYQCCWDIILKDQQQPIEKTNIVFFDDKIDNVNAAKTFGWNSVQFNFNIDPVDKLSNAIDQFLQ